MKRNMRWQSTGEFLAAGLDNGAWRLSQRGATMLDVRLRGEDQHAAEAFRTGRIRDLDIEWSDSAAVIRLTSEGRRMTLMMRSAIVHEPLPQLYDPLPLAVYDASARGFWRRVFRLVRIPGGRHLLGFLARRRRKGA